MRKILRYITLAVAVVGIGWALLLVLSVGDVHLDVQQGTLTYEEGGHAIVALAKTISMSFLIGALAFGAWVWVRPHSRRELAGR